MTFFNCISYLESNCKEFKRKL